MFDKSSHIALINIPFILVETYRYFYSERWCNWLFIINEKDGIPGAQATHDEEWKEAMAVDQVP